MAQKCHTGGTWGTVSSLPPGSLLCPARSGVKRELGGFSDLKPLPGTPPLGTGSATDVLGKRLVKFGPPRGGGGGDPPWSPCPTLCWLYRCVSRNPTATSTPHSRKSTLFCCHSQNVGLVPVVRLSYASKDIRPDVIPYHACVYIKIYCNQDKPIHCNVRSNENSSILCCYRIPIRKLI